MTDVYTYRVTWSPEDEEFVGQCVEFPSLSYLHEDRMEAMQGITELVGEVVKDMEQNGEKVPEPIAAKSYSGKFMVRVPPATHRRLSVEAAEEGVSLNRLVSSRL